MELEIGIEDLLNRRRVESDRIEFKASWNPDDIYHTVCAFANDYDNIGGGYIVIGVEARNGVAVRPVKGIDEEDIDKIQREMVGYNNQIIPAYFPKIVTEKVDGRWVIILWVTPGIQRPYTVPDHVTSKKDKKNYYYIRYGSSSVRANSEQECELIDMSNMESFETRPNFDATEDDISYTLLVEHLKATNSRLSRQVRDIGVMGVLEAMQLLSGPSEQRYIQNVALMMFCDHVDKFFPYTQAEITLFPNGCINDPSNFVEIAPFKGSVPTIISNTVNWIRQHIISEKVTKVDYQMEAIRRFNYPYEAVEEVVVNAFYHRDYRSRQPVNIEIEPDCIRVVSFPGIDRSVPYKTIEEGERFVSKYTRNKRLGEFLKELDFTEAKSSGIPTIQDKLRKNGSSKAVFKTDEDRRAVIVEIPIHPDFLLEDDSIFLENLGKTKPDSGDTINEADAKKSDSDDTINEADAKKSDSDDTINEADAKKSDSDDTINEADAKKSDSDDTINEADAEKPDSDDTINGSDEERVDLNDVINSDIPFANLTEYELKVMLLIMRNNKITRSTLVRELNCGDRTISRAISGLIDKNIIRRVGSRKIGYWEIIF